MTSRATSRSATASDTMSQLDGVRSLRTIETAVQTSVLPTIVPTIISEQTSTISAASHAGRGAGGAPAATPPTAAAAVVLFTGVVMATGAALTSPSRPDQRCKHVDKLLRQPETASRRAKKGENNFETGSQSPRRTVYFLIRAMKIA